MKDKLIRYYFDPRFRMQTGCLDYSETFRHPTPEQIADALKIGNKFRLWLILHPDYFYFGEKLTSFNLPLLVSLEENRSQTSYELRTEMCLLCPCMKYKGNLSVKICPDITPRFFGVGVVKMVEAKTDEIAKGFPCLEWVRYV